MKYLPDETREIFVTSYAEVWIEICQYRDVCCKWRVTSYAEVWIEIIMELMIIGVVLSHLLRGGVD